MTKKYVTIIDGKIVGEYKSPQTDIETGINPDNYFEIDEKEYLRLKNE